MEALFTPIWPSFTDREVRVDYKGTELPVYRRGSAEGIRVQRAYITFRKAADRGTSETWVVKKIKLFTAESSTSTMVLGQPLSVLLTDLEGCAGYSSKRTVPWWLMQAVVQAVNFTRN